MGEQKDIGKLKENNERLKMEMNSLKAMLAAQAKEDASNLAHTHELEVKQAEITKLEKRVAELEKQLAEEKAIIQKLEADLKTQKDQASLNSTNHGQGHHHKRSSGMSPAVVAAAIDIDSGSLHMPNLPANYVSPEVLAKHKNKLSRLEEELRAERMLRREADGEVIKLRAAINGVQLNEAEVNDLLAQKLQEMPSAKESLRYVVVVVSLVSPQHPIAFVKFNVAMPCTSVVESSVLSCLVRNLLLFLLSFACERSIIIIVLVALGVNLAIAILLIQRRSSGLANRLLLSSLGSDFDSGLFVETFA